MIKSHILGFPRIGENRELKFALESFWKGESDETQLQATASSLRKRHWQEQIAKGLDFITVGDFSLYDQTADHIQLLGCEPERFHFKEEHTPLSRYFTMVRGQHCCASHDHEPANTFALEMTKWFDTNYHYMVPEFTSSTGFSAHTSALLAQVEEAKQFNHPIKVSLIGPLTFLYLGKSKQTGFQQLDLLHALIPVYVNILKQLAQAGVEWVQLDEPILGLDLSTAWQTAFEGTYQQLHNNGVKILLGTYFSSLNGQISAVCKLPIDGLHIDCIRAPQDLKQVTDWLPNYKVLSLGLIDGRNIWKSNLDSALSIVEQTFESGKGELWLAPSCSLLHVPYQFAQDQTVHAEVKPWLAGAIEKLSELRLLKLATNAVIQSKPLDAESKTAWLTHQSQVHNRASSRLLNNPVVKDKLNAIAPQDDQRNSPFATRQVKQQDHFKLPLFPTTTIGSFPQTANIRGLRARLKKSEISQAQYWDNISQEIRQAIEFQERIGLDVLVHGEAERNDMVEFFGERLDGFTFSANGWVQSYGSRCVKPPILFGDVSRPAPMTVDVAKFAQSLSEKPVKGMLTGPVTILQWSFVRNDQARSTTALQIALAIREEVQDLEAAGIGMIQIDEPAFREGLPLRQAEWKEYLEWAARAFRISASGVQDNTQIHTHMCYSEFNDILADIAAMDADVITIETSRSDMELLRGFGEFKYPNEIGPGVYDIHSPRIPHIDEVLRLFRKAIDVIPAQNLWINPDCGLKTRGWKETEAALCVMVDAAKQLRQEFSEGRSGTQAA